MLRWRRAVYDTEAVRKQISPSKPSDPPKISAGRRGLAKCGGWAERQAPFAETQEVLIGLSLAWPRRRVRENICYEAKYTLHVRLGTWRCKSQVSCGTHLRKASQKDGGTPLCTEAVSSRLGP